MGTLYLTHAGHLFISEGKNPEFGDISAALEYTFSTWFDTGDVKIEDNYTAIAMWTKALASFIIWDFMVIEVNQDMEIGLTIDFGDTELFHTFPIKVDSQQTKGYYFRSADEFKATQIVSTTQTTYDSNQLIEEIVVQSSKATATPAADGLARLMLFKV